MGEQVNVYDAKTNFSRLVARAENGDEIVISRHGRPVARLIPYTTARPERTPGQWRGKVTIGRDFDEFAPSEERDWYGE